MIARLTGKLHELGLDEVVLDVRGVGYHVHVPIGTAQRAPRDDDGNVSLLVYTAVREDAIQLFGFASTDEKAVYKKLISVSGVGPKIGLNVLSSLSVSEVVSAVRADDYKPLTAVSGIGKKTAQRLVLELRNAFDDLAISSGTQVAPPVPSDGGTIDDVRAALLGLEYQPAVIEGILPELAPLAEAGEAAEALVRKALKMLRN